MPGRLQDGNSEQALAELRTSDFKDIPFPSLETAPERVVTEASNSFPTPDRCRCRSTCRSNGCSCRKLGSRCNVRCRCAAGPNCQNPLMRLSEIFGSRTNLSLGSNDGYGEISNGGYPITIQDDSPLRPNACFGQYLMDGTWTDMDALIYNFPRPHIIHRLTPYKAVPSALMTSRRISPEPSKQVPVVLTMPKRTAIEPSRQVPIAPAVAKIISLEPLRHLLMKPKSDYPLDLKRWLENWGQHDTNESERHRHSQELVRYALADVNGRWFYSICQQGWKRKSRMWHCRACGICKSRKEWHCGVCKQCADSLYCDGCCGSPRRPDHGDYNTEEESLEDIPDKERDTKDY